MVDKLPVHPRYAHVENAKDADAVGRAFLDSKTPVVEFPFKFYDIKPHEMRAKVLYTGLCHTDVHIGQCEWSPPPFPCVPGHEIISRVTHVGSDVKDFKVGDVVGWGFARYFCGTCENCKKGNDNICIGNLEVDKEFPFIPTPNFGGWATHVQAPAKTAFHIPEKLPLDRAPPLLCAGLTMWAPLVRWGTKGCRMGIIGIGGLGHMGIKFGSKLGFHVTAFTSKPTEKSEELKKMGAEEVYSSVEYTDFEKLKGSFDCIINTVYTRNEAFYTNFISLIKPGGTFCQVALPDVKDGKIPIELNSIVLGQINLCGSLIGSIKEMKDMLKFAAENDVLPTVELHTWEEFPVAYEKCAKGTARYRCVVDCGKHCEKLGLN